MRELYSEKEKRILKYLDDIGVCQVQPNQREAFNDKKIKTRKELIRNFKKKDTESKSLPNRKNKKLLRLGSSSSCDDITEIVNI